MLGAPVRVLQFRARINGEVHAGVLQPNGVQLEGIATCTATLDVMVLLENVVAKRGTKVAAIACRVDAKVSALEPFEFARESLQELPGELRGHFRGVDRVKAMRSL